MTIFDLLGYAFTTLLLGGLLWGLIDLLARIQKQPHQAINILRMSPYPFVPDDESSAQPRESEGRWGGSGGLRLSPVPVETRNRSLR